MMSSGDVLVVIPAYNEAATIGDVVTSLRSAGMARVLVVNDGSTDTTADVAAQAGAAVIHHAINRGPGAATQTGLQYALLSGAKCVVTIDADMQHDVDDMAALIGSVSGNRADLAIGNRFMKGTNFIPRTRVVFNALANLVTYIFCSHWVSDTQSGYKAFSRKAIELLDIRMDGFAFCSEMIIKAQRANLRVEEIPISVHYSKETIRKGQGFRTGVRTLAHLVQGYIFK